jgi:hypothetical protein
MRRIVLALTGVVLVAAVMAAPAVANHSWGGDHWARTSNPFTVTLGDNVSSTWDTYLQTAAADWSADAAGNPVNAAHTCMDHASNPDADNMHPNAHDYQQLASIYAHLDSTTTVGLAGSAGARPYSVERTDRPSRSKVVERFSDGSKRITFIYWTNAG